MTRQRLFAVAIGLALGVAALSGAAIVWASTLDNPEFAEPLIWLFVGSLAFTKLVLIFGRPRGAGVHKREGIVDAAAVAGSVAFMVGEPDL